MSMNDLQTLIVKAAEAQPLMKTTGGAPRPESVRSVGLSISSLRCTIRPVASGALETCPEKWNRSYGSSSAASARMTPSWVASAPSSTVQSMP